MQVNNVFKAELICRIAIALVWFINGLFCKVLNLVPRHQQIVARILGDEHAPLLTSAIGVAEALMAVWVLSRIQPRLCILTQVLLVAVMNLLEFFLVPDLLLFGRMNLLVAACFIAFLLFYDVYFHRKKSSPNFST